MINPYIPPEAKIESDAVTKKGLMRTALAFISGLVGPPATVFTIAKIVYANSANGQGNVVFWGSVLSGSVLAALICYQPPKIPVWLTLAVGPVAVVFVFSVFLVVRLAGFV
jgi:hypothetical protein